MEMYLCGIHRFQMKMNLCPDFDGQNPFPLRLGGAPGGGSGGAGQGGGARARSVPAAPEKQHAPKLAGTGA